MLAEVIDGVAAGTGAVVALSGEPGIGKTALLGWAADRAAHAGINVLQAAASGQAVPFDLLVRALAPPDRGAAWAARQVALGATPLDFIDHGAEPLQRHADALADRYERAALERPTLVLLDDLDRADVPSCVGALVLARRAALVGYAVIVSWRDPLTNPAFAATADALTTVADHRVEVGPLSPSAVSDVVAVVAGALPTPALVDRLQAAGGNPLLVLELAEAATSGREDVGARSPLDALTANIIGRLGPDDLDTLELLRVAAAFGPELDIGDLATAMRRTVSSLIGPLDRARAARVLEGDGAWLRFVHYVLRDAMYQTIDPPVRAALHLDIARALQRAGAPPSRTAPHIVAGAHPGDGDAIAAVERAALDVMPAAPALAAGYLARAVELAPPTSMRDRLATEHARALCWSGQVARGGAIATEILSRPHEPALDSQLGFVSLRDHCLGGRLDAALALAAAVPDVLGANPLMQAQLAKTQMYAGDLAGAERRVTEAIDVAGARGDDAALVLGCSVLGAIRSRECRFAEAIELSDRAVRLADATTDGALHHHHPYVFRVSILAWAGEDGAASAALARAEEVALHLGIATPLVNVLRAAAQFRRGEWNDLPAETSAEVTHADEFGGRIGVAWAHALDGLVALHRGQPGTGAAAIERSVAARAEASASLGGEWLAWGQALLLAADGDDEGAVTALAALADAADAVGAGTTVALVAPDLVRLAVRAGHADVAARSVTRCQEIARVASRPLYDAIRARCHGLLTGDGEELAEAAVRLGALGRSFDGATAAHDAAVALAPADAARAAAMLHDAIVLYEALDAQLWLSAARADAHRLRLKLPPRRSPRPTTGWESLTATERLVVAAVADGLANATVAARLGISKRTVEAHLRNIFAKLGATSRLAVATMVARDRPDLRY